MKAQSRVRAYWKVLELLRGGDPRLLPIHEGCITHKTVGSATPTLKPLKPQAKINLVIYKLIVSGNCSRNLTNAVSNSIFWYIL